MSNETNNSCNKRKRQTPKFQRPCGLCVESGVESGVESDICITELSPDTELTIAKRVRKRRRSCTENVKYYYNESDDDIDYISLAERLRGKQL